MAVNKVLLGNDIAAVWNIANANLSGTIYLYMITPNSKELIPVNIVTATRLTFDVPADIQKLGDVRFDLKWKEGTYNRRLVVNKIIEFVDNPESVTSQSGIITTMTLTTTGVNTTINVT